MALFCWSSHLETGNQRIDRQHRKLFELTNALARAVGSNGRLPEAEALVTELREYADTHFCDEEQLMRCSSLPSDQQDRHVCAHRSFIARVEEIAARTDLTNVEAVNEFLDFLIHWLVIHILKMDYPIVRALPNARRDRTSVATLSVEKVLISALTETERRFRTVADDAPAMIWISGSGKTRDYANRTLCDFLGVDKDSASTVDWFSYVHPDDRKSYLRMLDEAMATGEQGVSEIRVLTPSGDWAWILERVTPRIEDTRCIGLIAAAIDVTAIKKSEELLQASNRRLEEEVAKRTRELQEMVLIDPLTGIANRRKLMSRLKDETDRSDRYGDELSICFIDVDLFKGVNDTYGHQVGDRVLARIAKAIEGRLRRTDLIARYGGEEFVVLLIETCLDSAVVIAEALRALVSNLTFDDGPDRVTISLGVTQYAIGETPDNLLARADRALLRAKTAGRDRFCVERPVPSLPGRTATASGSRRR